jgi:hypothetical protein
MGNLRRRAARLGAATILAAGLLGFSTAAAFAEPGWVTELDGAQVVPGPGDVDGFGIALLAYIDPGTGDLCWTVTVELLAGAPGDSGTLVFDLTLLQDAFGRYKDCLVGQDPPTLQDIVDNPSDYFFQVSTTAHQGGAIRGQLEGVEVVTTVHVGVALCPEGIATLEEARAAGADGPSTAGEWNVCAATYPGDFPLGDPPHPYYVEPVAAELDLRILPAGWSERIVSDAIFLFGNGVCNPSENWCTGSGWFEWESIPAGDVEVYQEVMREGYQLGWTMVTDGSVDGIVGDSETVSLTLDGSEGDVWVWFFNVVEPPPPTAGPTAPVAPGPTLSVTPPPTSTADATSSGNPAMSLALALLVIAALGSLAASVVRRSNRLRG